MERSIYSVIKSRYVTEKSRTLEMLKSSESNRSLKRMEKPKYVFLVDAKANKREIAEAIERIYSDKKIKVQSVNTINVKPKKKQMRGRKGKTAAFKKAIVTLNKGDSIEDAI